VPALSAIPDIMQEAEAVLLAHFPNSEMGRCRCGFQFVCNREWVEHVGDHLFPSADHLLPTVDRSETRC
jgi:hypothetical protein